MRTLLSALPVIALLILSSSSASAQSGCFGPPYDGLDANYSGGVVHLNVELVSDQGFYNTNCWTNVVGVQVYRRTVGVPCGEDVLITPEPLDWNEGAGTFELFVSAEIVDTGVEPNRAYQYVAKAVSVTENAECWLGYVSTGPSLICRGALYQWPDCGISMVTTVQPCLVDCFAWAMVSYPAEAQPYLNTGTTLAVYGEFNGVFSGFCNSTVPVLNITDVEELECVTATESMSWGRVKAKYR